MGDVRHIIKPQSFSKSHFKTSHNDRFEYLLESGFLSDINLLVGPGKTLFKAHKLIIATGSPIMYEEIINAKKNFILIKDTEPEIFYLFLKFMYTGTCRFKIEETLPLMQLAVTYNICDLIEKCKALLKEDLTDDRALLIFQQAVHYNNDKLIDKTIRYICRNAWSIIEMEEFTQLKSENLKKLLSNDRLFPMNETQLILGIIRWAKAECNRRTIKETAENIMVVSQDLLYWINWDRIEACKFTEETFIDNGLSKLFSVYVNTTSSLQNSKRFRKYFEDDNVAFTMSRLPHKFSYCSDNQTDNPEVIQFKTDVSICLISIGIPGMTQSGVDYFKVTLHLSSSKMKKAITLNEIVPHTAGIYHLKFPIPFKVIKDNWYTISCTVKNAPGFGNTGGKPASSIKCIQPNGKEVTVKFDFKTGNRSNEDIFGGNLDEFLFKLAEN